MKKGFIRKKKNWHKEKEQEKKLGFFFEKRGNEREIEGKEWKN